MKERIDKMLAAKTIPHGALADALETITDLLSVLDKIESVATLREAKEIARKGKESGKAKKSG